MCGHEDVKYLQLFLGVTFSARHGLLSLHKEVVFLTCTGVPEFSTVEAKEPLVKSHLVGDSVSLQRCLDLSRIPPV